MRRGLAHGLLRSVVSSSARWVCLLRPAMPKSRTWRTLGSEALSTSASMPVGASKSQCASLVTSQSPPSRKNAPLW